MNEENIPQLIQQNKLLIKLIADMCTEMKELKENLTVINKALAYKTKAEDDQNWKDNLRAKFRADLILKSYKK